MERLRVAPRPDWRAKFDAMGFSFHSMDGVYWDESVCYRFSAAEIDRLEHAAQAVHALCLEAVAHVVSLGRYAELDIPAAFVPLIERSWQRRDPSLYGRFDFSYDGVHPPRMLEYNADTPTSVLETAVAQWHWIEETGRPDQFNSLHERLIGQWRRIGYGLPIAAPVHFCCARGNDEDWATLEYLRDTALQAGLETRSCAMEDIGWDGTRLVDLDDVPLRAWFKLYPWEWLMREPFGAHLAQLELATLEPPWKAILSNKGILPILWELFPDHPNLLPAYRDPAPLGGRHVAKPLHSREGANITLQDGRGQLASPGPYAGPFIYQGLAPLPRFDDSYPVLGCWIVGDEPAGMGIREDISPITTNASRFIPHFFDEESP